MDKIDNWKVGVTHDHTKFPTPPQKCGQATFSINSEHVSAAVEVWLQHSVLMALQTEDSHTYTNAG